MCVFVAPGSFAQIYVAVVLEVVMLAFDVRVRPFADPADNHLQLFVHFEIVLVLLTALVLRGGRVSDQERASLGTMLVVTHAMLLALFAVAVAGSDFVAARVRSSAPVAWLSRLVGELRVREAADGDQEVGDHAVVVQFDASPLGTGSLGVVRAGRVAATPGAGAHAHMSVFPPSFARRYDEAPSSPCPSPCARCGCRRGAFPPPSQPFGNCPRWRTRALWPITRLHLTRTDRIACALSRSSWTEGPFSRWSTRLVLLQARPRCFSCSATGGWLLR